MAHGWEGWRRRGGVRARVDAAVDAPGRASHRAASCLVGTELVKSLNGQLDE